MVVAFKETNTVSYLNCPGILAYLWEGGYGVTHIAIELGTGSSIVRAGCRQLMELGITEVTSNDDYCLTEIGKEFCSVLYKPIDELKQINLDPNLIEIALSFVKQSNKPSKTRIKILQQIHDSNQKQDKSTAASRNTQPDNPTTGDNGKDDSSSLETETADNEEKSFNSTINRRGNPLLSAGMVSGKKEFWRMKLGLHPVQTFMKRDNVIACHELSVSEQIKLCYERIERQKQHHATYQGCKPNIAKQIAKQVEEICKEEDNRISQLGYFLPQPLWVAEASKELNHLQGQIDISVIEADKATDKELKKALEESYKDNQKAFVETLKRYSAIADECEVRLNYCLADGDSEYQNLTVWVSHQEITEEITSAISENFPEDSELTFEEQQDKILLEKKVKQGMYSTWAALRELHDRKLYRPSTWEAYTKKQLGFTFVNANFKIHAANAYDALEPTGVLPTSERLVRPLRGLPQEEWEPVWMEAIAKTEGKPTAKVVTSIVERIKQKTPRTLEFEVGDVVIISRPIKYSGCWGIVEEMDGREFTISVSTWKEEAVLIEDPDKVARIDSPSERTTILDIWHRCKALRECENLDPSVYWMLEGLGRQTFLTDMQEKLLTFFEMNYLK